MAETNVECGEVRLYPIKQRVMRWTDDDPFFETTTKVFKCQREPGHGGDHWGLEDTVAESQQKLVAYWKQDA